MAVRRLAAAVAIAVAGVLVLGGGSASAATYLRTDPGDALLSGSTLFGNTASDRAVLATSTGTFTCQGTSLAAQATGNANPSGSLTATLTALTFSSCADDGAPVNFSSCALHSGSTPPTVQLDGDFTASTVWVSGIVERCAVQSSSSACYYTQFGTATGTYTNATSSLELPSIALTRATTTTDGLSATWCGASVALSTTVTHVVQQSTSNTLTVTKPPPPPTPTAVRTDPGNSLLAGATTLRNTASGSATFTGSNGTLTCAQAILNANFTSNANVTTSITGQVTSLTLTSCTDTASFINFSSCSLHGGSPLPQVHLTGASSGGGYMRLTNLVVRCALVGLPYACYFAFNANGPFNNTTSSISFANSGFSTVNTTSDAAGQTCISSGWFSVLLAHIVQGGTNRTVTLTTS
jgi:hypothetical protein